MRFSVINELINYALPSRCPVCGVVVAEQHNFCLPCWSKLKFLGEPGCAKCGKPFVFTRSPEEVCATCLIDQPQHDGVRAVVQYDDVSGAVVMRLKYGMRLGNADLIANHMIKFLDEFPDITGIIPVPLHRHRLWARGYNQSMLIANTLAKSKNLNVFSDILVRLVPTPPLRNMDKKKRKNIVKSAFQVKPKTKSIVCGGTFILIDDVYTTGATANACAKALKRAGAKSVFVFCWARVLRESELV